MNLHDKAIEALRLTHDGNNLAPEHLSLTQAAQNRGLTEQGEPALSELHAKVWSGDYQKQYLCGIENLSRDSRGYAYWRDKEVEHYSHQNNDDMKRAAAHLAESCQSLESKGFPVNSRTAICDVMRDAPAGTPWLEALCRYYSFFVKGDAVRIVFYKHGKTREAVAMEKRLEGTLEAEVFEGAYEAYHGTIAHGFQSAGCGLSYAQVVELLERSRLTPEEIHAALV